MNATAKCTASGKRKRFWYVGTDISSSIGSNFFRTSGNGHGNDFNANVKTLALPVETGTKRIAFAISGDCTLKSVIDVDGMGLDIKDSFTKSWPVSIYGAYSASPIDYTAFVF